MMIMESRQVPAAVTMSLMGSEAVNTPGAEPTEAPAGADDVDDDLAADLRRAQIGGAPPPLQHASPPAKLPEEGKEGPKTSSLGGGHHSLK